jgi:arylsulfatase A-like enzyme
MEKLFKLISIVKNLMTVKKNVILVTIDCLRADHVGFMGYSHDTTPFLDSLAQEGLHCSAAFAVGPVTPVSFLSLMTSTYPLKYRGYTSISNQRKPLAEVLSEQGFDTAAFHSNPYLSRFYGYERGFHTFYDSIDFTSKRPTKMINFLKKCNVLFNIAKKTRRKFRGIKQRHVTAEELNKKVIEWMKTCSPPFFLWIHYMDVHAPYFPPSQYLTTPLSSSEQQELFEKMAYHPHTISKSDLEKIIDLYDAEIRYVDDALRFLITTIKNMFPNTAVIITSDHGDEFGEHGGFLHGPKLYDELLHVPLLLWASDMNHSINAEPVSLMDVAPTILDMLNIPAPSDFQGSSLLSMDKKRTDERGIFSEVSHKKEGKVTFHPEEKQICYRTAEWKYIYKEKGEDELYNLKDDPHEQHNVHFKEKEITEKYKQIIIEHMKAEEKSLNTTSTEERKIMKGISNLNFDHV